MTALGPDADVKPGLRARWVLVIALAAMLVLFGLAMLAARHAGADHGTYPDWLAAFATLAAFGAAGVAGWYAHRALLVEQARDKARDDQQARAQAELVAAWVDTGPIYGASDAGNAIGGLQVTSVWIMVRNASQLPVTNVDVALFHHLTDRLEPQLVGRRQIQLLAPEHAPVVAMGGNELAPMAVPPDTERGARVMLTFTDAGGRTWVRSTDGALRLAVLAGRTSDQLSRSDFTANG